MLVMVTEGGETKHSTNINFLLEEFGIMANSGERGGEGGEGRGERRRKNKCTDSLPSSTDVVTRTTYYKYFHPKEALISNGVLNRLHPPLPSPLLTINTH